MVFLTTCKYRAVHLNEYTNKKPSSTNSQFDVIRQLLNGKELRLGSFDVNIF